MTCTYSNKPSLLVPVCTPFKEDGQINFESYVTHCKWLLANGAHGLAVLGTNSETNSLTTDERKLVLEKLIQEGINPNALMPGTGSCALEDSVTLSKHALDLGCPGLLVMPPFFFPASQDGVYSYFSKLIDGIDDSRTNIYLYHFPKLSGVPISPEVIEKLLKQYPKNIAGIKDSEGVWEKTKTIIDNFDSLEVYSGSESLLTTNISNKGGGCISGSANANPHGIRNLIDNFDSDEHDELQEQLNKVRSAFEKHPLIAAVKAYLAKKYQDENWAEPRVPLMKLDEEKQKALFAELDACNFK